MSAERVVMLGAELYGTRESVHFLFGEEYEQKIAPYCEAARSAAKRFKCSPLAAVPKIFEAAKREGQEMEWLHLLCLVAAALDIADDA